MVNRLLLWAAGNPRLERLIAGSRMAANIVHRFVAAKPRVRLVKGAYSEPLDTSVRSRAEVTAQYKFLTDWLFGHGSDPAFGTHDDACIEHAIAAATRTRTGQAGFEFQMLYGVRRDRQERLANEGFRVRVYIPFGSGWYPYLMRRMAERPANLRFFARALAGR